MAERHKQPKRRCKICREWFHPRFPNEQWCCPEHGAQYGIMLREKEKLKAEQRRRKETQQERRSLKIRKAELLPASHFKQQAQQAFNSFIRARDHNQPCISCGETNPPDLHGGQWDCGHYLSVGAHEELRFEERNAYRQCKSCNGGSGRYARKNKTVSQQYRERLIQRVGQAVVDWLEGPHEMTNYRKDDYIRIRDEYRAKARALIKQREVAA